jgi:hypothetical protein
MKKKVILLSIVATVFMSCTDAERAKLGGYGDKFKVEMVNCDGSVTNSWVSSGKVLSEQTSDGYYFNDDKTGALIEVTGNLIITKIN